MNVNGYARALYELALEEQKEEKIYAQLGEISRILGENSDFCRVLDSPAISKNERTAIVDRVFGKQADIYVLNFLKLLSEKRAARYFGQCFKEYEKLYREEKGVCEVIAVSAVELSPALREKLAAKMREITGREIYLISRIDPEIMGGLVIHCDNSQIDASIRTRLDDMRRSLIARDI